MQLIIKIDSSLVIFFIFFSGTLFSDHSVCYWLTSLISTVTDAFLCIIVLFFFFFPAYPQLNSQWDNLQKQLKHLFPGLGMREK